MSGGFPQALPFSFADSINRLVDWRVLHYGDHLRSVSDQLLQLLVGLETLLRLLPWWLLLWYQLSEHPVLLAVIAVISVLLSAFLLWRALSWAANRRLKDD